MAEHTPDYLKDETPDFSSGGSTQSALLQNLENERDPMLSIDDDYEVEVVEARVAHNTDDDELPEPEGEADAVAALAAELSGDHAAPVAAAKPRSTAARTRTQAARKPSPIPGMIKAVALNPIFIAAAVVVVLVGGLLTAALMFSSDAKPAVVETVVLDSQGVDDAMIKAAALEAKGDFTGALRVLQGVEVNAPEGLHPSTLSSDVERLEKLAAD